MVGFKSLVAAVVMTAFATGAVAQMTSEDTAKTAALSKPYGSWGFDTSSMDTSVKPGDDFLSYAEGKRVAALTIPGDLPLYGAWVGLGDLSDLRVKALVLDLAARTDTTGDERKISDLYKSAMDMATRDRQDLTGIAPDLKAVAAVRTRRQMTAAMGRANTTFGTNMFSVSTRDDPGRPDYRALFLREFGLGLPDRDYYLDDKYADKKAAYAVYIADMLRMADYPDPDGHAHAIVAFETAIARDSWSRTDRRDPVKTYNAMTMADLPALAPGFDWKVYMAASGVTHADKVVVVEKSAIPKLARLYAATPLDTLKAWETFSIIDQAAPYLSTRFRDRNFAFQNKTLYGDETQPADWKLAVNAVNDVLGEAVGRYYVAQYFPPETKAKAEALVSDLLVAMKARVNHVAWMSDATKAQAAAKLDKMVVRVGYPNRWKDYSALEIRSDDFCGNIARWYHFEWNRSLAQIDKPIDHEDWDMTPQTANSYNARTRNEIIFPAAILQPPFFDPNADTAVNYGAIGAIIGHEITHGFDDTGRHYDGDGTLRDWWTPSDKAGFEDRAKALGAQYDAYEPIKGFHVQGQLTMDENIADLGGALTAIDAYHLSLNGQPAPVIDGFTGDQRVFLGWTQIWATKYRDDLLKSLLVSDFHSPDTIRVFAPLRNIDAWYTAFNVQPGDKYYIAPEDRVRIW